MKGDSYRDGRYDSGSDPRIERRIGLVAAGVVLLFVVFLVRLFQLQIVQGADLRSRSLQNSVRSTRLEAPRGDLVDREGRVLATTRPAFRVQIIPNDLRTPGLTYRALGQLLEREPDALREAVGRPTGRRRFQPVVLERDLPYDTLVAVEAHRYALPGVVTDVRPRRDYLGRESAAHLLGTIGEIESSQLETDAFASYRSGDIIGQFGLESRLESHLRGHAGGRNTVVDVAGREIEVIDEVAPVPGGRVVLALDLDLQRVAEDAFRSPDADRQGPKLDPETGEEIPPEPDKMGALVALDPRSGDVLALVSRPAYDPNSFAGGIDADTWRALTSDEWEPLRNRALSGHQPPGSTYKALVAVAGLEDGIITPEKTVFCPGWYRLGRRTYRCWRRGGHGEVDLQQALVKSCDVYFYHLGVELGIDRLAHFARAFGLGRRTGIALNGEKTGLVPTREWKEKTKHEVWMGGETVSAAIGQGFNLLTPLQLAVAYGAIANGGTLVQPRLVLRLETWDGDLVEEVPSETRGQVAVSPEVLSIVRRALTDVVQEPGGTGGRARVRGMQVAGKTGTTQVVALRQVEGLEDHEIPIRFRDHAWFVAFAPAEAPEIVVAVLVEHGGGGGRVAAPIAQKVLARFYEKKLAREADEADGEAGDSEQRTAKLAASVRGGGDGLD